MANITETKSKYWMESTGERKRLASNHFIAKDAMDGKLVLAPVDFSSARRVLDCGTADGTWLLDLAASLPPLENGQHEFVGTDLNPAPFPTSHPENVSFFVQDIKHPFPTSYNSTFDLIHQRLTLLGAGPSPLSSLAHLYTLLKPGAYIQISEGTMQFPTEIVNEERTPAYCDMIKIMKSVAQKVGAEWHIGDFLKGWLEEVGFEEVREEIVLLNLGATNRDEILARQGAESCAVAVKGLSGFAKNFPPEKQPLPMERYETLGPDLEKELNEKGAVYPLKVVWGRKPE